MGPLRRSCQLLCLCLLAAPALPRVPTPVPYELPGGAAEYDDPYVAAGFRALFTCSAHFLMNRPLDDIIAVELADTAPLELPPPVIDEQRRLVRAADGRGRHVTAAYRDTMGCSLLPPHWSEGDVPRLPYVSRQLGQNDPNRDYPLGDRAAPAPTREQRALLDRAFDATTYGNRTLTTGVLVLQRGRLVAERYRPGFGAYRGYRTWSTAKSITATLIGIAVGEGLIDIDAAPGIPQWRGPADPRGTITFRHLLGMSSGLWTRGSNTYALYFAGQDAESSATATPLEVEPGSRWEYSNNDTLLLLLGLKNALGNDLDYLRFPYDKLFGRIGMHHTWMETDHLGNFIGSSQVYTTARDLGRLGQLYLDDGTWEGERILPEGWTRFVAEPTPALQRQPGDRGYGAQFWLLDGVSDLPAGTYTTAGNKGQLVTIVPAHQLVVVRTGVDPLGARWDQPRFVRHVIDAFD